MNDEKRLLEELIKEAIDGGWEPVDAEIMNYRVVDAIPRTYLALKCKRKTVTSYDDEVEVARMYIGEIIFSHSFAKSLFGETDIYALDGKWPSWEYHLMGAVISDDPIKCLYEAVKEK